MFKFSAIVFDLDCEDGSNFFRSMFADKLERDVCNKIWLGVDEDDIIEQITEGTGWCVESYACEKVFENEESEKSEESEGDSVSDEVKKLDALLDTYYEAGFDKEHILGLLIQVRDVDFCEKYFPEFNDGSGSEGDCADGEPDDVDDITDKVKAIDISDPSLADFEIVMLERLKSLSDDSLKIVSRLCSTIISERKRDIVMCKRVKLDRAEWFGVPKPHLKNYAANIKQYNRDYHSYRKWNDPTYPKYVGDRKDVLELCKVKADKKKKDDEAAAQDDDGEAGAQDDDGEAGAKGG